MDYIILYIYLSYACLIGWFLDQLPKNLATCVKKIIVCTRVILGHAAHDHHASENYNVRKRKDKCYACRQLAPTRVACFLQNTTAVRKRHCIPTAGRRKKRPRSWPWGGAGALRPSATVCGWTLWSKSKRTTKSIWKCKWLSQLCPQDRRITIRNIIFKRIRYIY